MSGGMEYGLQCCWSPPLNLISGSLANIGGQSVVILQMLRLPVKLLPLRPTATLPARAMSQPSAVRVTGSLTTHGPEPPWRHSTIPLALMLVNTSS
jgi:hypothetical protein